MLRSIEIENFKCFDRMKLACTPLTLLSGLNGTGKSSIFQALLVLRQSLNSGELHRGRLILNGDLVDLGTSRDVLHDDAEYEALTFVLKLDGSVVGPSKEAREPFRLRLEFDYSVPDDELLLRGIDGGTKPKIATEPWQKVPPLGGDLIHVNAERIGPRDFYGNSRMLSRFSTLGSRGEYAVNLLHARQNENLPAIDPRRPDPHGGRILDVVDFWLQAVTPGVHLQLERNPDAGTIVAGFSFDRPDDLGTKRYRATNVGFGLSYVLPVLAGLLAPPGTLCLIENPEAHLHPRGQTKLAELAVLASLAGVQVMIETHSDHFIDGVRIAVRDELIQPDDVAIHYFERAGSSSVVSSPRLGSDGRLSSWPTGFFDQHEENLVRLLAPKT